MIKSPGAVRIIIIFAIVVIFLLASFTYYDPSIPSASFDAASRLLPVKPANSTLGFGGVYVVSGPGSPRRDHIEQAAAVTELNLTIPEQVSWTDDDVTRFRIENETESGIAEGSVKAWLSHHLVLKAFLESGLESALILEDDVDWDVRLRVQSVPRTQRATRELLEIKGGDTKAYPWGETTEWDLLYLGHCGDYFNPLDQGVGVGHHHPEDLDGIPRVVFQDDSVAYHTDLHPFTASLLTAFRIPEKHRILHRSKFPLCTFGYAVTRRGAETILNEVAPAKEELTRGARAYDVAILDGCTRHSLLRCFSLQPELFHHMEGRSIIDTIDDHPFRPPVDLRGLEQVQYRRETSNIDCGFFWGEFYWNGDLERLDYLKKEVGRKGKCLKRDREGE